MWQVVQNGRQRSLFWVCAMARTSSDRIAVRPQVGLRPSAALREKLEAAAAASGRSLAHEAEHQLERAFEPAFKVIMRPSADDKPSARLIRALFTLFEVVNADASAPANTLVRAGLASAFEVLLQENFPDYKGMLLLSETNNSNEELDRIRQRMAAIARTINSEQRFAIYGEPSSDPGESLLQSAIRLGIVPSDPAEAALSLSAAAEAAKSRLAAAKDDVLS
jgi:hypothetical protein